MNVADFTAKWRKVELTERSAAQQHFLDLCELVGHPKPADVDPTGDSFTFERGAAKADGGDGWRRQERGVNGMPPYRKPFQTRQTSQENVGETVMICGKCTPDPTRPADPTRPRSSGASSSSLP